MTNKIRGIGVGILAAIWLLLAGFSWFGADTEFSDTERRPLAQMPELNAQSINDRSFMTKFEEYTLDQFPLRETFRQAKALFHFYGLMQSDKEGLYVQDGYLADMEYEMNASGLEIAQELFGKINTELLAGKTDNIYLSIIPDKNYYLAEDAGRMRLDISHMEQTLQQAMPWAHYIDIKSTLTKDNYYRTDTHWRQESIIPTAAALCNAMGAKAPVAEQFRVTELDRPFYGVYYGQVAMPVSPDPLRILESDVLSACTVTSFSTGNPLTIGFYNEEDLHSPDMKDPYNVFLYGFDETFVIIENPNATTDRELLLFRDSFGCSMAPLLVENYARVTVVDLRTTNFRILSNMERMGYLNLQDADVLFLFSSLVLNNPTSFRMR